MTWTMEKPKKDRKEAFVSFLTSLPLASLWAGCTATGWVNQGVQKGLLLSSLWLKSNTSSQSPRDGERLDRLLSPWQREAYSTTQKQEGWVGQENYILPSSPDTKRCLLALYQYRQHEGGEREALEWELGDLSSDQPPSQSLDFGNIYVSKSQVTGLIE